MILGFCGRCRSGKTELANVCKNFGYEKLSFAIPLKNLCADILDVSIDGFNKIKDENTPINITIGNDISNIISEETEIPIDIVQEKCNGVVINNARQMLQFIGTDLIRNYNEDWHVNRIKQMINNENDYVFDDVRFPNEMNLIKDLGGECWFVIRPTLNNISNHESETSIKWNQCFNKIIINDSTLNNLIFKWEIFMDNYVQSCTIRDKEFKRILENGSENQITPLSTLDVLMLSKHMFTYVYRDFSKDDISEAKMTQDNTVLIKYNDGSLELINNALNIEDLKQFIPNTN